MQNVILAAFVTLLPQVLAAQTTLREPLEVADARWLGAKAIADGASGGAARFDGNLARIDVGPCPVSSQQPFTLRCALRTTAAGFSTPLIARAGEAVGLSLVVGRTPGTISFEAWSWRSVRLTSRVRIDDGNWHRIEVPYDPASNVALLFVDDVLQGSAALGLGAVPEAVLRLGDNVGAHQPFAGDLDEVEVLGSLTHPERFAAMAPIVPVPARTTALHNLRKALLEPEHRLLQAAENPSWAEQWPPVRAGIRAHVLDGLGLSPTPARPPLDVQVHGELVRDGVRLQRLSWIGFPGQRATGWLWLPDPLPKGRLPTVLCPHGHWDTGARHPVVQARCSSFARFGWIALAVDSVHGEHIASGVNAIGAMTWHNQRAIDLLLARDDVDPARLACTGASGGAQQTYYLMAIEDRIAVAAPMVMACYFTEIVDDTSSHCACNHAPRIAAGTDVPPMCAVFAPKPVMFGSVTGDWTHNFPQQGLPELRAHWASLRGPEPRSRHANEGHNYDRPMREEVYAFLHDTLVGPATDGAPRLRVAEPEFRTFTLAELEPLYRARPDARLDTEAMAREHLARRAPVRGLAELAPKIRFGELACAWHWDADESAEWRTGSGGLEVPVPVRMRRTDHGDDVPYTVFIDPRGGAAVLAEQPAWLTAVQRPVLAEPRPYGEWASYRSAWQRNGILLGCGEGYQAAYDVAQVCHNLPGAAPVHVVGLGEAGVVALLAAHLCPRIVRIVTDDLGPSYAENGNRLPLCPELLRWRDLPELIRTLPATCDYELGGAVRELVGSPNSKLCPPFSASTLADRLRPTRR